MAHAVATCVRLHCVTQWIACSSHTACSLSLHALSLLARCGPLQVKAWCYYESRLLGAHHGLISTYALETLVLYVFNKYHHTIDTPLTVRAAAAATATLPQQPREAAATLRRQPCMAAAAATPQFAWTSGGNLARRAH